jgi:hypothetical protein
MSGYLFELPGCKESDPPSIRRKKRVLSVLGAQQGSRLQLIDRLDEQLAAIASAGDVNELRSVGSQGDGWNTIQRGDLVAGRKRDGEPNRGGRSAPLRPHTTDG